MSIDESFCKNVFLLSQVVPGSSEFRKYFRKGMFDRPNTQGFIHVSHYLLSIHNARNFARMVQWPVICKSDEKRYREQTKVYIEVLANKNRDINFPPVLGLHLFHTGGPKLLIIMWKISQIALRSYITRECKGQIVLLKAPSAGQDNNLTETFFINTNVKRDTAIIEFHNKTMLTLENIETYMKSISNDRNSTKVKIFEVIKSLERYMPLVPVSPLVAKRLMNIEDTEIIHMWKSHIKAHIKYLVNKYSEITELQTISGTIRDLVLNLCTDSKILNGNELIKIHTEAISKINPNDHTQHLFHGLHANGLFVLEAFTSILSQVLQRVLHYLKIHHLSDLSICPLRIKECIERMKLLQTGFQEEMMKLSISLLDTQSTLQERSFNCGSDKNLSLINEHAMLRSPNINFCINKDIEEAKLYGRISLSPVKGKHKRLFARYKRDSADILITQSVPKSTLNNSIQVDGTYWKSPRRRSSIYNQCSPNRANVSPKYSRILSPGYQRRNSFKGNNAASTPKQLKGNVTPKRVSTSPKVNLDIEAKKMYDLTQQLTNALASLYKSPLRES